MHAIPHGTATAPDMDRGRAGVISLGKSVV
jgi:hypothetical protein